MNSPAVRRLFLATAVLAASLPFLAGLLQRDAAAGAKPSYFEGKVLPLAPLLEKAGAKLDGDAAPHWLALVRDDGTILPLVKDDGSRMFFQDAKLVDRKMRLTGNVIPRTTLLQVVDVHSFKDGRLHEVYYWCDVCSIRRRELKICECCGGPMYRREEPVGP